MAVLINALFIILFISDESFVGKMTEKFFNKS
jgi:hypothetical protein